MPQVSNALDDGPLSWAQRGVWVVCVAVYLTVFLGGIQAGGAELVTLGRAVAFTLLTAVLGRIALGLLSGATVRAQQGPMTDQEGPLGSLADLVASTNVAQQHERAQAVAASLDER